jgi:predicted SAM-dependent methyltransferase
MQRAERAAWKSMVITGGIVAGGVLLGAAGGAMIVGMPAIKASIAVWNSPRVVREYMRSHPIRKLQIGAGQVDYPGWLNTDIAPGPEEAYLDATRRFPVPDGSIQYIFGEHVIEHLSYDNGLFMLRECYRVLAPGGKIRLATPNLMKYLQLFQEPKTEEVRSYLRRKIEAHGWPQSSRPESMILNLEMKSFGHQYLYDPHSLSDRLTQAGFRMITEFPPGESDDPQLRGVESRHNNSWRAINDYESMILQAVHP